MNYLIVNFLNSIQNQRACCTGKMYGSWVFIRKPELLPGVSLVTPDRRLNASLPAATTPDSSRIC